jgi:hypothetical protein
MKFLAMAAIEPEAMTCLRGQKKRASQDKSVEGVSQVVSGVSGTTPRHPLPLTAASHWELLLTTH